MIPFEKYKELLGEEGKNLSDEEVKEIRQAQYGFAELAFESWLEERNSVRDGGVNNN